MPRRPKPTAVKELQGNPGRRQLPTNEPKIDRGTTPPSWLDKVARAEWRRLRPVLEPLGLLTAADRAAFAAYCDAYSRMVRASEDIEANGMTYITDKGTEMARPSVWIVKQSADQMHKFLVEFGLTPASRTKVEAKGAEKKSARGFLFGGGDGKGASCDEAGVN